MDLRRLVLNLLLRPKLNADAKPGSYKARQQELRLLKLKRRAEELGIAVDVFPRREDS